jgi:prepilin-type N-terminal cleavage/methylation domain-containing protein
MNRRLPVAAPPGAAKASLGETRPRGRAGFTLLELMASAVVLGAAAVMTAQVALWSRAAARTADQERLAWHEASNCLERLTAEAYEAVTPARAGQFRLSEECSAALSAGQLTVTVKPVEQTLPGKRITVEVTWEAGAAQRRLAAQPRRAVRLTTILYAPPLRRGGGKP